MFQDQHFYESKVFLRAYKDAQECLKQTAEHQSSLQQYDQQLKTVVQASKRSEFKFHGENVATGQNYKDSKLFNLFNFSNTLFPKYFSGFDSFTGGYSEFKQFLNDGLTKMRKDLQ